MKTNLGTHVSRYKQWEVLPKHKWSGKWFKLAVGNDVLQSYILGENVSPDIINEAERQGYQVIDVPLELKHDFELDLNRALIDFAGIAIQSAYKYIQYTLLAQTFNALNINPFKKDLIEIGMYDVMTIKEYFIPELVPESLYSKKIYIHCDLSKNGDRTGISAVAVLGYKDQNRYNTEGNQSQIKEMIYKHIFTVGIEAPPNSEISFQKIRDFIHYLKYDLGWNIVGVSFDGYNSVDMRQQMELDGFKATIISLDRDDKGYSTFRNALTEKRISMIDINELTKEITALERNATTGKIDHPPQCLVGTTKIRMVDGNSKTILQLLDDVNRSIPNYVYTFNEKSQKIEPKLIKNVWQTGYRKDLYKITLDNNTSVICTGNHPFMTRDGNYIYADELSEGQSLMPLYTKIADKGLVGYRLYYEPMEDVWRYEHSAFDITRNNLGYHYNYVTHHANYNKLDNRPSNLKYISKSQHKRIHNRNQTDTERLKRSETVKQWHQDNKNTIAYAERNEKTRQSVLQYFSNNPEARKKCINKRPKTKEMLLKSSRYNQILYTDGINRKYFTKGEKIPDGYYIPLTHTRINKYKSKLCKLDKQLHKILTLKLKESRKRLDIINKRFNKILNNITKPSKIKPTKRNNMGKPRNKLAQIKKLTKTLKKVAYCKIINKSYNDLTKQELYRGGTIFRNILRPELKTAGTIYMNKLKWYTNGEQNIYIDDNTPIPDGYYAGRIVEWRNHKIIKIEKLNKYQKVYDIEVEDNHNFALDIGIFVHNSIKKEDGKVIKSVGKDLSDSICGAVYNASISVDISELDYMEGITLYDTTVTVSGSQNQADQYFGFTNNNLTGGIQIMGNDEPDISGQDIQNTIINEITSMQGIINKIKADNPNTKLSNQQIKELYDDFSADDFLIF